MKSKLLNTARLLSIFLVSALTFVFVSCDKTETTDSTGFILHYLGVTDIGPSMSYTLKAPAYKGSAPYDFTITNVTFNDETYSNNDNFVINAETGEITIQNTEAMEPGLYSISVGCYSNGKFYSFKDAVQVNMLLAVPEGVSVEPAEVLVKMEDENWWEASAQVTTDAEKHVSITKYEFAEDESKEYIKYFTISNTGVITFNPDHKDKIIPGEKYILSLKLTTKAGEHLYPDAVTFNVISKPLNLLYTPNSVRVEQSAAHESQIPTIQGSAGMIYSIKSVTPEVTGFTIDETTGKISLAENSSLAIGNIYKIDVTVANEYGTTDFAEAYTVTIVDFINPIDPATFTYEVPETYEEKAYTIPLNKDFSGDEVIFSFADDNTNVIKEQIEKGRMSIDKINGTIFITEKNTLTPNNYTIKVKAINAKGEATTSFNLEIKANPNKFTFHYGNNLGLTPAENYASQHDIDDETALKSLVLNPTTDLNGRTAKWEIIAKEVPGTNKFLSGTTINETTGEINFQKAKYYKNSKGNALMSIGVLIVKATLGEGDLAYSVTTPVFIRGNEDKNNVTLKYSPFAIKMNPKTGGQSDTPKEIQGITTLDFRTNFSFFDLNTTTTEGTTPATSGSLLNELWINFYKTTGANNGSVNTGAKKPMSSLDTGNGFDNTSNLNMTLGYINQVDNSIIINPNMWKYNSGEYANGILTAQVAHSADGTVPDKNRFMPVVIWFDENFE